jgi:hypothetical protein
VTGTLIASITLIGAPPSVAEEPRHQLRNQATGLCLDSNHDGHVYTLRCNGGDYQKWVPEADRIHYWENSSVDSFHIKNVATGRCLDSNHDGHLYTLPCQMPNRWQSWDNHIDHNYRPSEFKYDLRNVETGRDLDSNHAGHAYTEPPNGGTFQHWAYDVFQSWAPREGLHRERTS